MSLTVDELLEKAAKAPEPIRQQPTAVYQGDQEDKRQENDPDDEIESNIEYIVSDTLKSGVPVSPDLKIDDRDIPLYPNFYQFAMDKRGLGIRPYPRQLVLAIQLMGEYCPRCSKKAIRDVENIPKNVPLESFPRNVAFLEHGKCPKCRVAKSELVRKGELNCYEEMDLVLGQRSGKSTLLGSMVAPYMLHRWIKLQKPQELMGLLRSTPLVGTLCAQTFQKAQELLFQPLLDTLRNSPWFVEYHKLLDHYQQTHGEILYKIQNHSAHYLHRGLLFYPSGPNKRTLRGPTRIFSALDELGWFPHGEDKEHLERASANEVYAALDRSLKSVRMASKRLLLGGVDSMPTAIAANISSPSEYFDKMMTLVRTHKGSPDVLTAHLATWDFNPNFEKHDFEKEYRDDAMKAERDFGANPPVAANPWMSDPNDFIRNLTKRGQRMKYKYAHKESPSGQKLRHCVPTHFKQLRKRPGCIMGLDAGHVNNSFAVSVVTPVVEHKEDVDEDLECPYRVLGARTMLVAEVAPDRNRGVQVNHTLLSREFLYYVIDAFNVKLVLADRWNSIKMLSDMEEDLGVMTNIYSMKPKDFDLVLDFYHDEDCFGIECPAMEIAHEEILKMDMEDYPACFKYRPISHLYYQCIVSNKDAKGLVQKGANATDDLLRSHCLALSHALDPQMVWMYEILKEEEEWTPPAMFLGMKGGAGGRVSTGQISSNLGARRRVGDVGGGASSGSSSGLGARGSMG